MSVTWAEGLILLSMGEKYMNIYICVLISSVSGLMQISFVFIYAMKSLCEQLDLGFYSFQHVRSLLWDLLPAEHWAPLSAPLK